jgi:hypothetical protein
MYPLLYQGTGDSQSPFVSETFKHQSQAKEVITARVYQATVSHRAIIFELNVHQLQPFLDIIPELISAIGKMTRLNAVFSRDE